MKYGYVFKPIYMLICSSIFKISTQIVANSNLSQLIFHFDVIFVGILPKKEKKKKKKNNNNDVVKFHRGTCYTL